MIIGVAHDQDGRVVQRLSVSTKVSIGLPPNGDRNHPSKLDHFVFLRKQKSGWAGGRPGTFLCRIRSSYVRNLQQIGEQDIASHEAEFIPKGVCGAGRLRGVEAIHS